MCRGDIVILLSPFSRMVPKSVAPFPSWDEALSSSSLKNAASDDYVKRQALVHVPGTTFGRASFLAKRFGTHTW